MTHRPHRTDADRLAKLSPADLAGYAAMGTDVLAGQWDVSVRQAEYFHQRAAEERDRAQAIGVILRDRCLAEGRPRVVVPQADGSAVVAVPQADGQGWHRRRLRRPPEGSPMA